MDIFYLHCPHVHEAVPLEEILAGVDALYKEGAFKRFGLRNHTAGEVGDVLEMCKQKSFVPPSVYQGLHNAVA